MVVSKYKIGSRVLQKIWCSSNHRNRQVGTYLAVPKFWFSCQQTPSNLLHQTNSSTYKRENPTNLCKARQYFGNQQWKCVVLFTIASVRVDVDVRSSRFLRRVSLIRKLNISSFYFRLKLVAMSVCLSLSPTHTHENNVNWKHTVFLDLGALLYCCSQRGRWRRLHGPLVRLWLAPTRITHTKRLQRDE